MVLDEFPPFMFVQGTNQVYKYLLATTLSGVSNLTITLTNNGVNKIYYLHVTDTTH